MTPMDAHPLVGNSQQRRKLRPDIGQVIRWCVDGGWLSSLVHVLKVESNTPVLRPGFITLSFRNRRVVSLRLQSLICTKWLAWMKCFTSEQTQVVFGCQPSVRSFFWPSAAKPRRPYGVKSCRNPPPPWRGPRGGVSVAQPAKGGGVITLPRDGALCLYADCERTCLVFAPKIDQCRVLPTVLCSQSTSGCFGYCGPWNIFGWSNVAECRKTSPSLAQGESSRCVALSFLLGETFTNQSPIHPSTACARVTTIHLEISRWIQKSHGSQISHVTCFCKLMLSFGSKCAFQLADLPPLPRSRVAVRRFVDNCIPCMTNVFSPKILLWPHHNIFFRCMCKIRSWLHGWEVTK